MRRIATFILAATLTACAGVPRGADYVPLIDTKDKDPAVLARDVSECQVYARQRLDAAQGAAAGAIFGAVLGALLAPRGYRNEVAGRTAALGAAAGANEANNTQEGITKRCLSGRGYNVLN